MTFGGRFEIVKIDHWKEEANDQFEPGYIDIQGRRGNLRIQNIDGQMDIRKSQGRYLFTWHGKSTSEPVSGYGNFTSSGDTISGRIYLHDGFDSEFVALKSIKTNKLVKIINRGLLIVKAKEPFREWISSLKDKCGITIKEIDNDCTVYLLPAFDDDHQKDDILIKVFSEIFVERLSDWSPEEVKWPRNRTLDIFKKWFELEFHSVVEDMCESASSLDPGLASNLKFGSQKGRV